MGIKRKYDYSYYLLTQESKASGWWDYVIRNRITRLVAYYFINFTDIAPNSVSLLSFLISTLGGAFFIFGNHWGMVIGALSFELGQILDGVDGLIARIKNMSTPLGAYMDFFLDRIRNVLVMIYIGIGQFLKEDQISIFMLLFLYIGIKKVYLVSYIYQEKILKDFGFESQKGKEVLLNKTDKKRALSRYILFMEKQKISPYYTDLDTDFLVFVLFPIINMTYRGLIVGSFLLLILVLLINLFFFKAISNK